ncbi:MAG: PAS domain S-box protein, partial [Methylomarinum sp.]|nr:PAS domain S-box protein [Methylomarinum sp.]
ERLLNLWQSCKQGNPVFVNGRKQRKDGSSFPVEVKITTYIENDKKYLLAIVRDITQRKEALEQQAETSKRLKRKADQLAFQKRALDEHAIVSITDVKGNIIYVNDKFESISQYSQDEVIGKNHRLLKSGFHPKSFFKEMWQTISSGKAWHGEIKNKAKDGSEYWVKSTIVPLLNDQGIPEQYIAIRTDVTYIKDLETRQEDINKALLIAKEIAEQEKANAEKASQAKSEFLSAMSHELRTPLNSILGFSQLLESDTEEPLTEDQNDSVGYIIAGGKHLLALINEILELSSIEAGKVELSIEPILLNDIINESLPLLNTIAETTNIEIRLLTNLSTSVQADYTKLKQVLLNLISNAIKYNKDGGSVSIDWQHTEDDFVRISITDTGIGISETNQDHVFGAFNRLGQEKSAIEGTGVGLVVTKSLVELMAGRIGFDSQENIGTTFWFELPTGEAENPPQTQQTIMVDNTFQTIETEYLDARPEKQILCVEDNAANRRLMQSFFNHKKGYTLHFAETGELGWEMITKQDFDLILMDIHLPGINGKELTNRLKEQTALKHIPVIAVTAAAMLHDIDNNKDLFDAYITKPIQFAALNDALKKYL